MNSERDELLRLAAKAAGHVVNVRRQAERDALIDPAKASLWIDAESTAWNPLTDDGDEARLEAALRLNVTWHPDFVEVRCDRTSAACKVYFLPGIDSQAARREAGVRVAAEIGRAMP